MEKVIVCVTGQKTCEKLIHAGADLAKKLRGHLSVVHVVKSGFAFLGANEEGEALEYLFEVSKSYGADMMVYRSDDVMATLIRIAVDSHATQLVLGAPGKEKAENDLQRMLVLSLPQVKMTIVA